MKKAVLVVLAATMMFGAVMCGCSGNGGAGAAGISFEEFKKISTGMTQKKVEDIIGGKGTKISETKNDTDKYIEYITVYKYPGETTGYAEIEYSLKSPKDIMTKYPENEVSSITQYDLS